MNILKNKISRAFIAALAIGFSMLGYTNNAYASSHREAPLISMDPQADNTDLYAFRSPDDTNTITIIANYIPFEKAEGGPNWYTFGENVRYEIHIVNDASNLGNTIIYRFTFSITNEDPTTFFNIRLGKQNLKTTYTCQKSTDNGSTWTTIVTGGIVPPPNIGPRSIDGAVGLGTSYATLMKNAIETASGSGGEQVFAGPVDDPFFVDLGGIFDLGAVRQKGYRDGLYHYNTHTIALKIPISTLQKNGKKTSQAVNILDPDFVIGVWASASRPAITTFNTDGTVTPSGAYVQVSRIGMPLTNEAIIPVGVKDHWNAMPPDSDLQFASYFENPELALYMDDSAYGKAVPGLGLLRIQEKGLADLGLNLNFRNGAQGLYVLKGSALLTGTALAASSYGSVLLPNNHSPRAVDILPIFYTGVPNAAPYQLATGKPFSDPLAPGKPFINNFLPTLGDMLRLNMAVPVTPRSSKDFSSEGLIQAAVLGLTDARFNTTTHLQFIPNMDGFPNGRRLEDDVTRIELQAVGGIVLAAIGVWYDDYIDTSKSPVTAQLVNNLTFVAGPTHNDTTFQTVFPYLQQPWRGFTGTPYSGTEVTTGLSALNMAPPQVFISNYPNPFQSYTTVKMHVANAGHVSLKVYSVQGRLISVIADENKQAGDYELQWNANGQPAGTYLAVANVDNVNVQTLKLIHN